MNLWDAYRYNKKILDEVNDAVTIFNDPKSSNLETAMAHGAILMEEIICDELRKYRKVLPRETKESWDKQMGCLK